MGGQVCLIKKGQDDQSVCCSIIQGSAMLASPNMLSCDYSIFGQLKIMLQGHTFHSDEEVVTEQVNNVGIEIQFHAIHNLIPEWNMCRRSRQLRRKLKYFFLFFFIYLMNFFFNLHTFFKNLGNLIIDLLLYLEEIQLFKNRQWSYNFEILKIKFSVMSAQTFRNFE